MPIPPAREAGKGEMLTVYCPECGTPNTDQATSCVSCGHELKKKPGRGGRRFKGTMIMGNVGQNKPESEAPKAPTEPPAAEQKQPASPAAPSEPPRPKIPARGRFKQTMVMGSPSSEQEIQKAIAEAEAEAAKEAEAAAAPESAGVPESATAAATASERAQSWQSAASPSVSKPVQDRWSGSQPELALPTRRNTALWWGLGCLAFIVLSCVVASWWGAKRGVEHVLEAGGEAAVDLSRATLVAALVDARDHCRAGKPGPRASQSIHPAASEATRNLLCTVDETTMQKLVQREESTARAYKSIGDDDPILTLDGINPERCYEYDVDALHIIACTGSDSIKMKVVDVTEGR